MSKTTVFYDKKDPNAKGVGYVAVQTESRKPYVFEVFGTQKRQNVPLLHEDLALLTVGQAKRLFNFKKVRLEDLA